MEGDTAMAANSQLHMRMRPISSHTPSGLPSQDTGSTLPPCISPSITQDKIFIVTARKYTQTSMPRSKKASVIMTVQQSSSSKELWLVMETKTAIPAEFSEIISNPNRPCLITFPVSGFCKGLLISFFFQKNWLKS